jgi:carboxyl-terminal processing protease
MKTHLRFLFLLSVALLALISCNDLNNSGNDSDSVKYVNGELYSMMKEVYLWNTSLPSVNPSDFPSPDSLMIFLRNPQYDRWSTVITATEYNQYFEAGKMIGHGFMLGLDENENLRILLVYRSTQAYLQGVKRGWIVTKVNGTVANAGNVFDLLGNAEVGIANVITFTDENGNTVDKTLTKEEISITPVVHYEVLNQGGKKIGYVVFQDYIDAANKEFTEVFDTFAVAGIDEMIVDLRYNGGGSIDVANTFAGWLIGKNHGNQPFVNLEYNAKYSSTMNTTFNVPVNPNGLNVNRIFFIGTSNTASASELTINGVKPYVQSILAGSSTHGKPVGMNVIPISTYMALPVTFKYTNADGEGDFYEGLQPLLPANDDRTRNFGDPEEASLKAVLDYIETGAVPLKTTRSTGYQTGIIEPKGPISQYLKAY